MRTVTHILRDQIRLADQGTSCTIGNFDGMHRGHQELIKRTIASAKAHQRPSLALSFDPSPKAFFSKTSDDARLFTRVQKLKAFAEIGLDITAMEAFDEKLSALAAEQFLKSYLIDQLRMRYLCIGEDFRFGQGRRGDAALLKSMTSTLSFELDLCEPIVEGDDVISSSKIRSLISEGQVSKANSLLGHPYVIEGEVCKGDQLGRRIGFPTLNITSKGQIIPAHGIYAAKLVLCDDTSEVTMLKESADALVAAVNIGVRPTVTQSLELKVEAYVLDQDLPFEGIYGKHVGLYLHSKLRDEKKFAGLDELKRAIADDVSMVRKFFSN